MAQRTHPRGGGLRVQDGAQGVVRSAPPHEPGRTVATGPGHHQGRPALRQGVPAPGRVLTRGDPGAPVPVQAQQPGPGSELDDGGRLGRGDVQGLGAAVQATHPHSPGAQDRRALTTPLLQQHGHEADHLLRVAAGLGGHRGGVQDVELGSLRGTQGHVRGQEVAVAGSLHQAGHGASGHGQGQALQKGQALGDDVRVQLPGQTTHEAVRTRPRTAVLGGAGLGPAALRALTRPGSAVGPGAGSGVRYDGVSARVPAGSVRTGGRRPRPRTTALGDTGLGPSVLGGARLRPTALRALTGSGKSIAHQALGDGKGGGVALGERRLDAGPPDRAGSQGREGG